MFSRARHINLFTGEFEQDRNNKKEARKEKLAEAVSIFKDGLDCGGYLPVSVVSTLLDCSPQYVHQLLKDGRLEGRNFNGLWLLEGDSVWEVKLEREKKRKKQ